jgi:hypothetical protein
MMTQRAVLCRIRAGFLSFSKVPYKQYGRRFIAKLGERIFANRQNGNDSLHQDRNDNGALRVKFAT